MGPLNRYSTTSAVAVLAAAVFLSPSVLAMAGLVLLALAVHLFVWDPERDELFVDDWVQLAQVSASLASGVVGTGLLLIAAAVATVT